MEKMAVIKKSAGDHIFDFINAVFMCFMIVITLYPFIYVVMASLSVPKLFLAHTGLLLRPVGFSLESYEAVLRNPNIKIGYVNTVFIVVVGTLCNVIATAIGAYVLSRKGPFWKGPLMFIIVITMFVGGGLVPNYILIQNLGLYNSLWSLILPGLISTHNMIVMRTAFQGIPESLEESARIDGANAVKSLFYITIPNIKNSLALCALLRTIDSFRLFDKVNLLTGGGPANTTSTITQYLYSYGIKSLDFGFGSAGAIVMTVLVLLLSSLYIKRAMG